MKMYIRESNEIGKELFVHLNINGKMCRKILQKQDYLLLKNFVYIIQTIKNAYELWNFEWKIK